MYIYIYIHIHITTHGMLYHDTQGRARAPPRPPGGARPPQAM